MSSKKVGKSGAHAELLSMSGYTFKLQILILVKFMKFFFWLDIKWFIHYVQNRLIRMRRRLKNLTQILEWSISWKNSFFFQLKSLKK